MTWRKQGCGSHIGDDGPDLVGSQVTQQLGQRGVERKLAAGRDFVLLQADFDGGENAQVDVLDIREMHMAHVPSLPCAPVGALSCDRLIIVFQLRVELDCSLNGFSISCSKENLFQHLLLPPASHPILGAFPFVLENLQGLG